MMYIPPSISIFSKRIQRTMAPELLEILHLCPSAFNSIQRCCRSLPRVPTDILKNSLRAFWNTTGSIFSSAPQPLQGGEITNWAVRKEGSAHRVLLLAPLPRLAQRGRQRHLLASRGTMQGANNFGTTQSFALLLQLLSLSWWKNATRGRLLLPFS